MDVPRSPHPGGELVRCLNHFNWCLLVRRSSGPTVPVERMRSSVVCKGKVQLTFGDIKVHYSHLVTIGEGMVIDSELTALRLCCVLSSPRQYRIRNTAEVTLIVNKTPKYLNFSPWGSNSSAYTYLCTEALIND